MSLKTVLKNEEWLAVIIGMVLIGLSIPKIIPSIPKVGSWTSLTDLPKAFSQIIPLITLGIGLLLTTGFAIKLVEGKVKQYALGFSIVFILTVLSYLIAGNTIIKSTGVDYELWALVLGLVIGNFVKIPSWLKLATKTELFIKIGLVLLGCEIIFSTILSAGARSIFEVTLGLALVWYFAYYLAVKLGLTKSYSAIMATATSVCGVSAAIAACGAVKGKPEEVSHVVSLVLLFSAPMIILMPILCNVLGLSPAVSGAWIGGTIDNTASVAAAGAMVGEQAMQIASIVKLSQNVLIGFIAFLLAIYWTFKVEKAPNGKAPKKREIWERFPKFIIGFLLASLIFSFILLPTMGSSTVSAITGVTKGLRGWFFGLTFVSIGLTTRFKDFIKLGKGKPLLVFLVATAWDITISLVSAWIFFGGL